MNSFKELEQTSPGNWIYDVRDQLKRHVYDRSLRAFAAGDAARDAVRTPAALARRQMRMRQTLIHSLGGLPTGRVPLNARITGTVQGEGYRVEKIIFQSRPGVYVTANLYLPDGLREPSGAVLNLCGHSEIGKQYYGIRAVCLRFVQAGLIVMVQDPVGQGERHNYYEPSLKADILPTCMEEHQYAGHQCLLAGDSLARYFVHDAMRSVDYLCTRREVDPARIGVSGGSGGATQASLLMVCDPRLAAAAPGMFIMNRRTYLFAGGAQDSEQIWPGMSAAGFDHEDLLLAMCPKPVCVLAAQYDFFPIEGTRETVERCRRFWRMCGRPGGLTLIEDAAPHSFTLALRTAAAAFLARHLNGRTFRPTAAELEPVDPAALQCTRSGQVRGEIPGARGVFEENLERVQAQARARRRMPAARRRREGLAWLRAQVFRDRPACALNPRFYGATRVLDLDVQPAFWRSRPDLFNHGLLFRDTALAGRRLPVTITLFDDGVRELHAHFAWLAATCRERGRAVLVLETSGVGNLRPHPWSTHAPRECYGLYQKLNDDLVWLGDSLAALRTHDVLRALDMVAAWPGLDARRIEAYAPGRHGVYPRLAALLDGRLRRVEAPATAACYATMCRSRHYDSYDSASVILPGALKHMDARDLDGSRAQDAPGRHEDMTREVRP